MNHQLTSYVIRYIQQAQSSQRVTIRRWHFDWSRAASHYIAAKWLAMRLWSLHMRGPLFVCWTHCYCCRNIWWPNKIACTNSTMWSVVLTGNSNDDVGSDEDYYYCCCWLCSAVHNRMHLCHDSIDCYHRHRCLGRFRQYHCHGYDRSRRLVWLSEMNRYDWIAIQWLWLSYYCCYCALWLLLLIELIWMWRLPIAHYSMWYLESITLSYLHCHSHRLRVSQFDMSPNIRDMPAL